MLRADGKIVIVGSCGASLVAKYGCARRATTATAPSTPVSTLSGYPAPASSDWEQQQLLRDGGRATKRRQTSGSGLLPEQRQPPSSALRLNTAGALDKAHSATAAAINRISTDDAAKAVTIQQGRQDVLGACSTGYAFSTGAITRCYCVAATNSNGTIDATVPMPLHRCWRIARAAVLRSTPGFDGAYAVLAQPDGSTARRTLPGQDPVAGTGVALQRARLLADGNPQQLGFEARPFSRALPTNVTIYAKRYKPTVTRCFGQQPLSRLVRCLRRVARFEGGPPHAAVACTLNIDGNMAVDAAHRWPADRALSAQTRQQR